MIKIAFRSPGRTCRLGRYRLQPSRMILLSLALLVSLPVWAAVPDGATLYAVGEAKDRDSRQLVYREYHYHLPATDRSQTPDYVVYKTPDGRLLVEKQLWFRLGPTVPDVRQRNHLNGREIDVSVSEAELDIRYRDSTDAKEEQYSLENQAITAVDAGMEGLIRTRWDELLKGSIVEFHFPLVARGQHAVLRMRKGDCGSRAEALCLQVEPNAFLLRMLISPIKMQFSLSDQRLLEYRGPSNITLADGSNPEVVIGYRYPESEPKN